MQAVSAGAAGSARHPTIVLHGHNMTTSHVRAAVMRPRVRLGCYAQSSTVTVAAPEPTNTVVAATTADPVSVDESAAPADIIEAAPADSTAAVPAVAEPEPPKFVSVKQLQLRSAAAYLPHVNKESYGGEDAHFISNVSGGAIGVADGVGGWAESGINPAEYSRTLMRVACAYIEGADTRTVATASIMGSLESSPCASLSSVDNWTLEPAAAAAVVDPRGALAAAHKLTKLPGSATACVVQLCPEKKSLIAANLGDSGFIVVSKGKIALRSSPKQHFFDCPLQFGSFPEHVEGTDTVDDAEIFQFSVQPGDIIIAGSDGLWDNVYNKELLDLLPKTAAGVDDAADKIARLARRHAADPAFASPYTAEARAQGLDWPLWMKVMNTKFVDGKPKLGELTGGKMDDITVLVAMVEETEVLVPVDESASSSSSSEISINGNGASGSLSDTSDRTAAAAAAVSVSASEAAAAAAAATPAAAADASLSSYVDSPASSSSSNSNSATEASTVSTAADSSNSKAGAAAAAATAQQNQPMSPNMMVAGTAAFLAAFTLVMQLLS